MTLAPYLQPYKIKHPPLTAHFIYDNIIIINLLYTIYRNIWGLKMKFEKKYNISKLYIGVIAKQSNVEFMGLGEGFHWKYINFDVGIFIKKLNGEYLRITNRTIYPVASFESEYKIVINRTSLQKLAQQSPELAKEYPYLTKEQISWLEEEFKKDAFDSKNKPAETTKFKELYNEKTNTI